MVEADEPVVNKALLLLAPVAGDTVSAVSAVRKRTVSITGEHVETGETTTVRAVEEGNLDAPNNEAVVETVTVDAAVVAIREIGEADISGSKDDTWVSPVVEVVHTETTADLLWHEDERVIGTCKFSEVAKKAGDTLCVHVVITLAAIGLLSRVLVAFDDDMNVLKHDVDGVMTAEHCTVAPQAAVAPEDINGLSCEDTEALLDEEGLVLTMEVGSKLAALTAEDPGKAVAAFEKVDASCIFTDPVVLADGDCRHSDDTDGVNS